MYISKIRNKEYIYGGIAFRDPVSHAPKRHATCLGVIDEDTRKPIFNDKYPFWIEKYQNEIDVSLEDYASSRNIIINFDDKGPVSNQDTESKKYNYSDTTSKLFSIDDVTEFTSKFYGPSYLLNHIVKKVGLFDIIEECFPKIYKQILTIAQYYTIDPDPLTYCGFFSEEYETYSESSEVASQRISELFKKITESQRLLFYQKWSELVTENDYLALDTTSICTYSVSMDKAVFGKPKQSNDNKRLKQINLCLLFGENSGLPVYSCTYHGSINDVSLLVGAIQRYALLKYTDFKLVLDRGFYSKNNINYMINSSPKIKFIVGMPATTNLKNKLIMDHQNISFDVNHTVNTPTEIIYGISKRIRWDNSKYLYAHTFIDPEKFIDTHNCILQDFMKMYAQATEDPKKYFNDEDYSYFLKFTPSKKVRSGYIITKNQQAFESALSRAGWFILLSNEIKNPEEAIKIYRKRDVVEKAYEIFKNRTDQARTRVHNELSYENKYFIGFLSLIITSVIHQTMLEHNLYKKYCIKSLLKELDGIKLFSYNEYKIVSVLTAKHKQILDAFGCPYPNKLL
jgi:transposase